MSKATSGPDDGFRDLVAIMQRLRGPNGCPWDREQTFETLKSYLLEETYEVMHAIDRRDWPELADELGDLLLQPVFLAQMASEAGYFTIDDCLAAINAKLIRRHPHIFAGATAETAAAVKTRWDEIKNQEKVEKGIEQSSGSMLDDVLPSFPALVEANKLAKKAAAVGFEWKEIGGVVEKLEEEAAELVRARESLDHEEIEHELGDMLFTLVNLARFLNVDPEQALRKTNSRFRERFAHIETRLAQMGSSLSDANLDQMDELWQEAKRDKRIAG
jgi:MazG family protein